MAAAIIAPFWLTPGAWGAQTVTISLSLTFTPSPQSGVSPTTRTSGTQNIPCNFPFYFQGLQTIGTGSKSQVNTGNVSPLGYCMLHNTDAVNFVSIFSDASGASEVMRLLPGDYAVFPLGPAATLYAKADTASVALEIYTTAR